MENSVLALEFNSSSDLVEKLYQNGFIKKYQQGDVILDEYSYCSRFGLSFWD
jgi:CRP/FNR family transcriptional regulator